MADKIDFLSDDDLGFVPDAVEAPEPSTLENIGQTAQDTLIGAGQGIALGGLDELGGAAQGTYDYLTNPEAKSWLESYRNSQKNLEQKIDTSHERSPVAYKLGEIGGSILPALGTAGASAPIQGTAVAAKTALAPYLAKAAATGAGIGGLSGILGSKGTIEGSPGQLASDAGTGAVVGGALGSALGAGVKTLGWATRGAANKMAESPLLRQIKKAEQKGYDSDILNSDRGVSKANAMAETSAIEDLSNTFKTVDEGLSKQYGQVVDAADKAGITVPMETVQVDALKSINDVFQNNSVLAGTPEAAMLKKFILKMQTGADLTPQEALSLKKLLTSVNGKLDIPELQFVAKGAIDSLDTQLKKAVPGFDEANRLIGEYRGGVLEPLTGAKRWSKLDETAQNENLNSSVTQLLNRLTSPGHGVVNSQTKRDFYTILDNLKKMEANNPGLLESHGVPSIEALENKIVDQADNFTLTQQALGQEPVSNPLTTLKSTIGLSGSTTGRGMLLSGANKVGQARKATEGLTNVGKNLYTMSHDQLSNLGATLKNSGIPGLGNLGDYLLKGLNNKNEAVKNAALFSVLQNPNARDLVYNMVPFVPNKE